MRKQFLFVEGRTVVAFVSQGEKFADCSSFSDVTARVQCKVDTSNPLLILPYFATQVSFRG